MCDVSFYPPPPAPGSNAFGSFAFGISAFGDYPPFNWLLTIISQYANSPTLLAMLQNFNAAVDQTENFDALYDNVWNIATAIGYGLDVWGRIVGVNRNLQVSNAVYFGFTEGGTVDYDTFAPGGVSPFYSGQPATSNFALTDQAYRQLILAKALFNICAGSIPAINEILMILFGPGSQFGSGGECYCTDGQNMTMTYTFNFALTALQESIIYQSGALPKPVGVAASIVVNP